LIDYDNFVLDLRNLLHELKYCDTEITFEKLVLFEPSSGLSNIKLHYAFVAGVVEFYAHYHNWFCPSWVYKPAYFLSADEACYASS
jgi:hypothetical protein